MTPLEKRAEELAHKYGVHIVDNFHSLGTYKKADFREGFLQFKDQPEVQALVQALNRVVEEYSQETINEPVGSLIARIDNANHFVKEALKAWGEFVGDQALRGADEK